MRHKAIFISGLLFFLSVLNVFAEVSIKAEVDKTKITTDSDLTYKLIVTSTEKNIPAPQLPSLDAFDILSQAQSSTVSLMQSNIKTILVYSFILAAKETGKFSIGPAEIKFKGKTYSSEAFEIEVQPGKGKPQPKPKKSPSFPKADQPESEQPWYIL